MSTPQRFSSYAAAAAFAVLALFLIPLPGCSLEHERENPATSATESLSRESGVSGRTMAVTVDDLPVGMPGRYTIEEQQQITRRILSTLSAHEVPAIGFVNEDKLEVQGEVDPARVALLESWIDAGFELGNHGYSHLDLNRVSPDKWEADVLRGEVTLRPLLAKHGKALRYFRHPFLRTGRSLEVKRRTEGFLSRHGYEIAPVTIDNQEWRFGQSYADAGDDEALRLKLGTAYVDYMLAMVEYYEQQSIAIVGEEIPQILLIHAYALNADWLDRLLQKIEERGYRFITLEEAMKHTAYKSEDTFIGSPGITWIQRWGMTRGMPGSTYAGEPDIPRWVAAPSAATD